MAKEAEVVGNEENQVGDVDRQDAVVVAGQISAEVD